MFVVASLIILPIFCVGQLKFEETLLIADNDYLYSQDIDSGNCRYIATGYREVYNRSISKDIVLVKWKDTPGYVWVKHYSGPSNRHDIGRHVMKTLDGGYLVSGTTNSYSTGVHYDAFAMKLNSSGTVQWFNYWGGSYTDLAYSSCEDNNYYYIAGCYTVSSTSTNTNGFICCFNKSNGALVWGKRYKNYNNSYYLNFTSIIVGYDNYLYVTGTANSTTTNNALCIKINPANGNVSWSYRYSVAGKNITGINISKGQNSGYMISGYSNSSSLYKVWLLKLRGNGTVSWSKIYYRSATNDNGIQTKKTSTGYAVYGVTKSFGSDDMFLMTTDTSGNNNSVHYYTGSSKTEGSLSFRDVGTALLELGNKGYAMVSGQKNASNVWDLFLLRADQNGHTGCELDTTFLDSTLTVNRYILYDSLFNVTVYDSTITKYDITPSWDTICPPDSIDTLSSKSMLLNAPEIQKQDILIYPNPVNDILYVDFGGMVIEDAEIAIYDYMGRLVLKQKSQNKSIVPIAVSNLNKGVYFVQVRSGETQNCKKIVVD